MASDPARGISRTFARARLLDLAPRLAESALPFVLVLYLALRGGGFDEVVRSEVGIVVWWIIALGVLAGILPRARIGRAGWIGLGLLLAFAAWTALGIGWSESAERSAAELGRVAVYAGVMALILLTQGKDGLVRTVNAVALAIGVVAAVALLSRLQPDWLPNNDAATFFGEARQRLIYPVGSWNGLAGLMAVGLPLVLWVAVASRRLAVQALATAAIPIMALTIFYTLSRGGSLAAVIALAAFLLLYPRRLAAVPTLALAAVGVGLLIAAARQRPDLADNVLRLELYTHSADEGNEMLMVTLVVCVSIALLRVAIGLAARHGLGPRLSVSRRATKRGFVIALIVSLGVVLAAGASGGLGDRWEEFKQPAGPAKAEEGLALPFEERLASSSGNARYQYWQAALDANASDPVKGIGPGTFEYWWARNGSIETPGFVRDAHSLYIETLGELGIVGLLLIGSLIFGVLGFGIVRSLTAATESRPALAAVTAGCMAFAVASASDWSWELAVLPVAFLVLAGALLASHRRAETARSNAAPRIAGTISLTALAVVAIVVIAIPMLATNDVRDSQQQVRAGNLGQALAEARAAKDIQPYAASPRIQEALVLEAAGDLAAAAGAASSAAEKEPTNWRTWRVLSRIERERGLKGRARLAAARARSLNPRSLRYRQ